MFYGSSRDDEELRTKRKTDGDRYCHSHRHLGLSRSRNSKASVDQPSATGSSALAVNQQNIPGTLAPPRETDPLLLSRPSHQQQSVVAAVGGRGLWTIRSRRTVSKSPPVIMQQPQQSPESSSHRDQDYYEPMEDHHQPPPQERTRTAADADGDSVERLRQALSPSRSRADAEMYPTTIMMTATAATGMPPPQSTSTEDYLQKQHPPSEAAAARQPLLPALLASAAGAVELNRRTNVGSASAATLPSSSSSLGANRQQPGPAPPSAPPTTTLPSPLDKTYSLSSSTSSQHSGGHSSCHRPSNQPPSQQQHSHRRLRPIPSYGSSSPATHNHHPPEEPKDVLLAVPAPSLSAAMSSSSASSSSGGGGRPRQQHHAHHPRGSNTRGRFSAASTGRGGGGGLLDDPADLRGGGGGGYKDDHDGDDDDNRSRQTHPSLVSSYQSSSHNVASPILEIPEEIYQVRKAALQVLKPLTKTWVVMSVGFALTVLFGTSRWTRLMPGLPFWFILLPAWLAHAGLLLLHTQSAQNLSVFIAAANESRQRGDSRDHINRTEYLPLLQRSLKFGLKTGLLSFVMFCFEILIYVRMAKSSISLAVTFLPLWLLVAGGLADGIICKTQHWLRVACWILLLTAMVLVVVKVDHGLDSLRWRTVISPVILVLSIASGTLVYIVYGHSVGYYRLTESQLTAGNLYSLAALICIVLMIMLGEVIPLSRPVEIESRLFVVILAPLVISLVGMGAWVVSRDEYARLLLYGGQAAVHPMRLRWEEGKGWACVQGRGVVMIPMFGEVSFQPLERKSVTPKATTTTTTVRALELMTCCSGLSCYPYEDEETVRLTEDIPAHHHHPYLDPQHSRSGYHAYRGL